MFYVFTFYTVEEASTVALQCQKAGATMVHIHMYKLGSIMEFMRMAELLEQNDGPFINLSVSDFHAYNSWEGKRTPIIKSAALHASDCIEFSNHISQSYEKLIREMEQYLNVGFIPEICIFNKEGAENCAKLNQIFPKMFYTCTYLDYPEGLEATETNIMWMNNVLKDCRFNSFAIYNNKNDNIVKYIIKHEGHIRAGMEDSIYCGNRKVTNSIEIISHMARLVEESGYEVGDSI